MQGQCVTFLFWSRSLAEIINNSTVLKFGGIEDQQACVAKTYFRGNLAHADRLSSGRPDKQCMELSAGMQRASNAGGAHSGLA